MVVVVVVINQALLERPVILFRRQGRSRSTRRLPPGRDHVKGQRIPERSSERCIVDPFFFFEFVVVVYSRDVFGREGWCRRGGFGGEEEEDRACRRWVSWLFLEGWSFRIVGFGVLDVGGGGGDNVRL